MTESRPDRPWTRVEVDLNLAEEVMRATSAGSIREPVDLALRDLIARHERREVPSLRGAVRWQGDLARSRAARDLSSGG